MHHFKRYLNWDVGANFPSSRVHNAKGPSPQAAVSIHQLTAHVRRALPPNNTAGPSDSQIPLWQGNTPETRECLWIVLGTLAARAAAAT